MVRRVFIFLLILSTLLANFSRLAISVGFDINRKYIANHLCENRNKPWMHCNGHCYLMKKIKQAEENEKKQTAKDNLSRLEVSFFQEVFRLDFIAPVILENNQSSFPRYNYLYGNRYIETIFRPPKQNA